jgi:hypothetical protein
MRLISWIHHRGSEQLGDALHGMNDFQDTVRLTNQQLNFDV